MIAAILAAAAVTSDPCYQSDVLCIDPRVFAARPVNVPGTVTIPSGDRCYVQGGCKLIDARTSGPWLLLSKRYNGDIASIHRMDSEKACREAVSVAMYGVSTEQHEAREKAATDAWNKRMRDWMAAHPREPAWKSGYFHSGENHAVSMTDIVSYYCFDAAGSDEP